MNRNINHIETLVFNDSTVQLTGKFGTVELERAKLSTEIQGATRPGLFSMRMFIRSEGQKYSLQLTEELLLDDKIVDMHDRNSLQSSTGSTAHHVVADGNHGKGRAGINVYIRPYKELLLSLVMAVLGAWLASFRHGMNDDVEVLIVSSVLGTIAVLFVWTRGPLLRRVRIAGSQCVIRYWSNSNMPKTAQIPLGNVVVRTIACQLNGHDRVVDLLRADELVFFLVRNDKMFSMWSTHDAENLLRSGIKSV